MKSRGFGISNMFFFMAIFIILLIVVSFIVHSIHLDDKNNSLIGSDSFYEEKDKNFDYTSIEKNLKTAATLYQRDYYPDFDDKKDMYVTSKKLISLDYLNVLTDGKVSCIGYAKISYDNVVEVVPFIKCGNYYETKGYDADMAK